MLRLETSLTRNSQDLRSMLVDVVTEDVTMNVEASDLRWIRIIVSPV